MNIDRIKINNVIGEMTNMDTACTVLEAYMEKIRIETLGWALAQSCALLDRNKDPRKYLFPKSLEEYKQDFEKN